MTAWTGLAIWSAGALSFLFSGAYLIFIAMLLVASPLYCWRGSRLWEYAVPLVMAVLWTLFAFTWLLMGNWHGETVETFLLVWPAMLAAPMLLVLLVFPTTSAWLWGGVLTGALVCGVSSLWQSVMLGAARAEGPDPLNAILFGNFSLMLAFFCLAGLRWAWSHRLRALWVTGLVSGAVGGLLASVLSGTRGGWVTLPLLLVVLWHAHGDHLTRRQTLRMVLGGLVMAALVVAVPQTGVKARMMTGLDHASRYLQGEQSVETGARLEIWRGALMLIAERPLQGWGGNEARLALERLGEEGRIDPRVATYRHAHNDLLDAWARRGLLGALALLLLYITPIALFWGGLRDRCPRRHAVSTCGVLLAVGLFGFGLSYSFMFYPVSVALYTGWQCVFWGLYCTSSREPF